MLQLLTILKAILDFWNEAAKVNDPDLSPRDKKQRQLMVYIAFFLTSTSYLGYVIFKDRIVLQQCASSQYEDRLKVLQQENEKLIRIIQSQGQYETPFNEDKPPSQNYRDRLRDRVEQRDPT